MPWSERKATWRVPRRCCRTCLRIMSTGSAELRAAAAGTATPPLARYRETARALLLRIESTITAVGLPAAVSGEFVNAVR
jgi:hypothetical protein